jgi:hypothetical protein
MLLKIHSLKMPPHQSVTLFMRCNRKLKRMLPVIASAPQGSLQNLQESLIRKALLGFMLAVSTSLSASEEDIQLAQDYIEMEAYKRAIQLLEDSLETEYRGEAANELGKLYYWGDGVEKDYTKSADLYKFALEEGYYAAAWNLAKQYGLGEGVEKSAVKNYLLMLVHVEGTGNDSDTFRWFINEREKTLTEDQISNMRSLAKKCVDVNINRCLNKL